MGLKDKEDGSGPYSSKGLALLLSGGNGGPILAEATNGTDEAAAAAYVFGLKDEIRGGEGLYAELSELVAQRTQHERAGPGSSAQDTRPGRLGPSSVEVNTVSGQLDASASGTLTSTANFSSCRANACVFAGKWQYEITVCSAGIMQIGWATLQCRFTSEEGVGDAPDSYAYDGKRVKKWHVQCSQYGEAWAAGDVIGCCLDLDRSEASFYRNGRSMGVAFTGIRTLQPHLAYFPAVSLSHAERCELNFGAQPLLFPAPGYQPLQAPPPAGELAAAAYLVGCVERLASAVRSDGGSGGSGGSSAAGGSGEGGVAEDAVVYHQHGHHLRGAGAGVLSVPGAAAAGGAAGAAGAAAGGGVGPCFWLPWDSWLLLGSVAVEALAPLLLDSHTIAAVLLPNLLRLATSDTDDQHTGSSGGGAASSSSSATTSSPSQPHAAPQSAPAPLSGVLHLLELCLEPELLSAVVNCLMEALARRCVSAPLQPEPAPHPASCPYLALAAAMAARPAMRSSWLRHPNMWGVLEGFLTRKGPSPDDLRALLPAVWWRGCGEAGGERESMRGALQALSVAIAKVEERQYALLSCLLGGAGAGDPRDDALVEFLRYLVHKNRGATRDVPPPGLSDSTVLISAYLVLLRMLRVALPATGTFPAGALFVKTAMKADLEPVNSLVRLGGIVTHLCREAPVTAPAELQPLHLPQQQPAPADAADDAAAAAGGVSPSLSCAAASASSSPAAAVLAPPPASAADAWVLSRVAGRPQLAAELLDLAMTLYAFKVGGSVKMTHNLSTTLAASLAGLEEVERHLHATTASASSGTTTTTAATTTEGPQGAGPGAGAGDGGAPGAGAGAAGGGGGLGPSAASYAAYLAEARDFFRQEVAANIRFGSLLKVVFFSGWKQEASLALAAWLSRMLAAAASLPGPLLSYVPACYLDCILDTVSSIRHASEAVCGTALPPAAQAPSVTALRTHGSLGDIISLLVLLLHEPRICTPDAKEAVVGALGALLQRPGMLSELERNPVARERLVGAAVAAFDSRLWNPVAQVLLRLVRGQGFGEELGGRGRGRQEEAGEQEEGDGRRRAGEGSAVFRRLLARELRPEGAALQPFLLRLFNMTNWANSEFAATVSELAEPRSRRPLTEQQQQYRKAGIMFDLLAGLLRLLEVVAAELPGAFLQPQQPHAALNLNRLLEVVSFVLSHFTEGSDARRLTQLLTLPPPDAPAAAAPAPTLMAPAVAAAAAAAAAAGGHAAPAPAPAGPPAPLSSTVRIERSLLRDKVQRAHVLAPVVGALLGLWRGACSGGGGSSAGPQDPQGRADSGQRRDGGSEGQRAAGAAGCSGGVCGGVSPRQVLLAALLRHWDAHTEKQMAYLRGLDWRAALPGAEPGALEAGVREFSEMLSAAAAAGRQQAAAGGGTGPGGGGGAEAPEELLDPITSAIMTDPVVLPDSQVTVDRATIERHFLNSQTDPFSRTPLTREALRPNEEVKRRIEEWLKRRGV